MKEIAIIVPIYNVEKYIDKCLNSLENQTYKKIKIYAIIDGSPDNSIEIAKRHKEKDSRIVLIEKENGGYGSVLEYAINNINEEYFLICDPDDWLEDDAIEKLSSIAFTSDVDIVVGDKYTVYSDNNDQKYSTSNVKKIIKPNTIYSNADVGMFSFLQVSPHSKLYKTEKLKGITFPYKVSYTDFYLYYYALAKAEKVLYTDEAFSYYLIDRVGNTATDISLKALRAHLTVWKYTYDAIKETNDIYLLYNIAIHLFNLLVYCSKYNNDDLSDLINAIEEYRECLVLKKDIIYSCKQDKELFNRYKLKLLFNKKNKIENIIKKIKLVKRIKL